MSARTTSARRCSSGWWTDREPGADTGRTSIGPFFCATAFLSVQRVADRFDRVRSRRPCPGCVRIETARPRLWRKHEAPACTWRTPPSPADRLETGRRSGARPGAESGGPRRGLPPAVRLPAVVGDRPQEAISDQFSAGHGITVGLRVARRAVFGNRAPTDHYVKDPGRVPASARPDDRRVPPPSVSSRACRLHRSAKHGTLLPDSRGHADHDSRTPPRFPFAGARRQQPQDPGVPDLPGPVPGRRGLGDRRDADRGLHPGSGPGQFQVAEPAERRDHRRADWRAGRSPGEAGSSSSVGRRRIRSDSRPARRVHSVIPVEWRPFWRPSSPWRWSAWDFGRARSWRAVRIRTAT